MIVLFGGIKAWKQKEYIMYIYWLTKSQVDRLKYKKNAVRKKVNAKRKTNIGKHLAKR